MKFLPILAVLGLAACVPPTNMVPLANPGLPTLNCTVANFTSDSGDAAFIRNNRRKRFEIISTSDGFISNVTSAEFRNSTIDFAVNQVSADQISAVKRGTAADATLVHAMRVDRTPSNGTYRAVQTVTSAFPNLGLPTSRNIWTLACQAAG